MWAALLPLFLLLHPYEGLIQDARIYIGRGVADRDPAGVGQDILFTTDGQTGFTALRFVIRGLLGILSTAQVSMVLALVGGLLWLVALVALTRSLARDRLAWAAAVCVLALPNNYGSFQTFVYGETVATPRVFAEAAILGALAALLKGRRPLAFGLLALALAFHPLMSLPGLAIAAVMLAWEDRRWLLPIGLALAALAGAAVLKLPLADRLFAPMDATWLTILKERSVNLFPSLWDAEVFAKIAGRLAAVVVAATCAPPRVRAVLLTAAGVALGGLALTAVFGDRLPLILVTQLQTWRALWPLALLGNASLALAAGSLWGRGPGARLTLALLVLTWVSASLPLAVGLAILTVALRLADDRGRLVMVSALIASVAVLAAAAAVVVDIATSGAALAAYLAAARAANGEAIYAQMLVPGVQSWPLALGAIVLALRPTVPSRFHGRLAKFGAVAVLAVACVTGAWLWDSRTEEYRIVDDRGTAAADLRRLLGDAPGAVLWIDEYNESWFLVDRPAFFKKMQGGPILFSRALAIEWRERGTELIGLGLARRTDISPWTPQSSATEDLPLSAAAIEAFCRDPRHPAAIVAPGSQLGAVPAGRPAGLWHPPMPLQTVEGNGAGLRWRRIDTFTVVQCRPDGGSAPPGEAVLGRAND